MFAHLLIPTDGSEIANKAVQRGIAFAKAQGAKMTVIHVSPTFRQLTDEGYLVPGPTRGSKVWREAITERAQAILDRVAAEATKAGVKCETTHVFHNTTYAAIIATANKASCDVIVMGSHGYGAVKGVVLGSETTRVLSHTKIPVLVIR